MQHPRKKAEGDHIRWQDDATRAQPKKSLLDESRVQAALWVEIAVTDKGYDSDANRVAALARGITPVIPRRENSRQRGFFFPNSLYKLRARIEQTIGKLKRFKRVAMRCEKTDTSYSAIISFACGLMLVKSVHTT